MCLPKTNEGWSALAAVVSAVAALLNLIFIGLIIRYTIRQTGLITAQAEAAITQTDILVGDMKQRFSHDVHMATYALIQAMKNVLQVQTDLFEGTLAGKQPISTCPHDWIASAGFLVTNFPGMGSVPNQLDLEMVVLDAAVLEYIEQPFSAQRQEHARKVREALNAVTATIVKVMSYLR